MEMWKQTLKRDSIAWITVALLILAVSSPTHGQETKRFEFDTTTGWVSVDLEGKPLSKGGVKADSLCLTVKKFGNGLQSLFWM